MRIRITHDTHYRYAQPPTGVIQTLRLTPRNHDGQYVVRWRIDLSQDCRLDQREDAFGNIVHAFTAAGPFSEIVRACRGRGRNAGHRGRRRRHDRTISAERFPARDGAHRAGRRDHRVRTRYRRARERAVAAACMRSPPRSTARSRSIPIRPTSTPRPPKRSRLKRGVCQDLTHIFIAAARRMEMPARYVSGHLKRSDEMVEQERRPCLGGSVRSRPRMGRLRSDQRHLRHRRACARRGRVRLPRRGAGPRHTPGRRRRDARRRDPRRGPAAVADVNCALPRRDSAGYKTIGCAGRSGGP